MKLCIVSVLQHFYSLLVQFENTDDMSETNFWTNKATSYWLENEKFFQKIYNLYYLTFIFMVNSLN